MKLLIPPTFEDSVGFTLYKEDSMWEWDEKATCPTQVLYLYLGTKHHSHCYGRQSNINVSNLVCSSTRCYRKVEASGTLNLKYSNWLAFHNLEYWVQLKIMLTEFLLTWKKMLATY